jgi:hypothetical protein
VLLLVGQEDLLALIDAAFDEARGAHAARAHPAAELEILPRSSASSRSVRRVGRERRSFRRA